MPRDADTPDVEKRPANPHNDQFLDEVFPAELRDINDRRATLGLAQIPERDKDNFHTTPSGGNGLVGLALSGGGIRSATFNLGVLQALAGSNILGRVDYLSTVSGGGYIGATTSVLLNSAHNWPDKEGFPLHFHSEHARQQRWQGRAYSEPPALRYLRDRCKFLAPRGLLDLIAIPLLVLRGALVNFLALSGWMALLAVGGVLIGLAVEAVFPVEGSSWAPAWRLAAMLAVLLILFAGTLILTLILEFLLSSRSIAREINRRWLTGITILLAALAFASVQPWLVRGFWTWAWTSGKESPGWLTTAGVLAAVSYGATVFARVPRLARMAAIVVLGLVGPLLLYAIFLAVAGWLWIGVPEPGVQWRPLAHADGLLDRMGMTLVGFTIVNGYFLARLDVNRSSMVYFYRDRLSRVFLFTTYPRPKPGQPEPPREQAFGEVDRSTTEELKLSALNPPQSLAPYHLINAAVNLQGSRDKSLRGRNADFFFFSQRFIGSPRTGYCPTRAVEDADPGLDLGVAVATSAAAAAPNMGTATFRPLVFLMTLLNIRLGYWLPNPGVVNRPKRSQGDRERMAREAKFKVGLKYLVAEMFSALDEHSPVVNITDGGHIENLGVYELLRRRCQLIIACDAEADPGMEFCSLARVLRYARTDLGIDIRIDVDPIRRRAATSADDADPRTSRDCPLSRAHVAVGEIPYPDGSMGRLVYIKASLTGDENNTIRQYRDAHPDFPHETTADQFFDEGQFEAYRALGYHSAIKFFRDRAQPIPRMP